MSQLSISRRLTLASVALVLAAVFLHRQLADAVLLRGDESLARGRLATAFERYERAAWLDPDDGAAVDRLAFVATLRRAPRLVKASLEAANRYLELHDSDAAIRLDRGMLYRTQRRWLDAATDLERAGRELRDPAALVFAGDAERRLGRLQRAADAYAQALQFAPGFPAAKHGLGRL